MDGEKASLSLVEWNKLAASEEIANLRLIRERVWEEHSQSYRWLMASLLALHAGACLSIFGSDEIAKEIKLFGCGAFVIGMVLALTVAMFGQRSNQASLAPVQQQIGYWMTVVRDGERDDNFEVELADTLRKSSKIGVVARVAGWLSGVAFVSGVIISGYAMVYGDDFQSIEPKPAIQSQK
ncbi:MAG: hypothetical protein ACK4ZW_03620 [Blastomonas sp.]